MSDNEIPPAKNVGRKRMVDETTLTPEEAEQLEAKRAYNRRCAAEGTKVISKSSYQTTLSPCHWKFLTFASPP